MSLDEKYIQEAADRVMIQDLLARYAFETDYGTGNPDAWRTAALKFQRSRWLPLDARHSANLSTDYIKQSQVSITL